MTKYFVVLLFLFILIGCIEIQSSKSPIITVKRDTAIAVANTINDLETSVYSLRGIPFPEKKLSLQSRARRETQLEEARSNYERDPNNADYIIWYGRRLAYLGLYHESIRIFSEGLEKFPTSYKLYRHRGHRYITIRQFDNAIDDLQKAAFYSRPASNSLELDGIPNQINKPLSNDKYNIFYHLGIAYYLKGNYDKAISSYKKCLTFSDNNDLLVASTDWFYMTYRKIGNADAANQLLNDIAPRTRVVENWSYLNRILMYKEIITPENVLDKAARADGSYNPLTAHGVGNWYLYNGKMESAKEVYQKILLSDSWDTFGYIASEVDMLHL
ncbi:MAG: tetratricopeptide (TPR) repeat protein [Cyclobacteriaceae bacterium]|jgi:tetratricopeptide (TPR) repeat protein